MRQRFMLFCAVLACSTMASAQNYTMNDTKQKAWADFVHPSEDARDNARTKLWWFHGEDVTTKSGITADLEAFKKQGIGGVVYYDQIFGKAENAFPSFSKEWWEMFIFAASEAKRIGLGFDCNVSNGFVAGGPWVTKDLAMQRVLTCDTVIRGGSRFAGIVRLPADVSYHKDIALLAFPIKPDSWTDSRHIRPVVTSNDETLPVDAMVNGNAVSKVKWAGKGSHTYIVMDFGRPFTARCLQYRTKTYMKAATGAMNVPVRMSDAFAAFGYSQPNIIGQLEASNDGVNYSKVCDMQPILSSASSTWYKKTMAFVATTARYFRIDIHDWCKDENASQILSLGNIVLGSMAKQDEWEEKCGLYSEYIVDENTPEYDEGETLRQTDIIDISDKMDKTTGQVDWTAPKGGEWVVMRVFHTITGGKTKHGRKNFLGLECDKLSEEAITVHWNNYVQPIIDSLKTHDLPLDGIAIDSHEAGSQNWTPRFEEEFKRLRGYDIRPWLPALGGVVINSKEATAHFYKDMRRTIADLVSEKYFGTLNRLCSDNGLHCTAQAAGNGLNLVADNFQAKSKVERPQGEFWTKHQDGSYDIKEASSVAHLYGKQIASSEAFTDTHDYNTLADVKTLADYGSAYGINEYAQCASVYQPFDEKPGYIETKEHGRLFNRHSTYWDFSRPFWDYQGRLCGMARRGLPVADILVLFGCDAPIKVIGHRVPDIPEGYYWDACDSQGFRERIAVKNGRLTTPSGMEYKMLMIAGKAKLSDDDEEKIKQIRRQGVPVYDARNAENTAEAFLVEANVRPTIGIVRANGERNYPVDPKNCINFSLRRLADTDAFFLQNHSGTAFDGAIKLNTKYDNVELWDPTEVKRYGVMAEKNAEGLSVTLHLDANEAVYLMASNEKAALPMHKTARVENRNEIIGDWEVEFDKSWGGPGKVVFHELTDWSQNSDDGIKYYSGTAVYHKSIKMDKPKNGHQIVLKIPQIKTLGRVWLNGKEVTTIYGAPWEADITPYVKKGTNDLKIEVVNAWVNRLIGDAALPKDKRYTHPVPENKYNATDRLMESGIIGSVYLIDRQ